MEKDFKTIYAKHRKQLLPLALLMASFFIIFRVIMPQISDIQDFLSQMDQKSQETDLLGSDLSMLQSMSDATVDQNYALVTTALPTTKDIVLIFTELNNTASKVNVKLGSFSVKVGGIYAVSKVADVSQRAIDGVPYLNIVVNASGDSTALKNFADALYKSMPVVEIKNIEIDQTSGNFDVNFFFMPITVSNSNTGLKQLTSGETTMLQTLQSWSSTQ